MWGVVFWALIGPAKLPLAAAGALFFLIVWGTEQIQLPVLELAPWPWKWGLRYNAIDAGTMRSTRLARWPGGPCSATLGRRWVRCGTSWPE